MRYARSDVTSITIGGHTHTFDDAADPDSDVLTVDCPDCDPVLAADPLWAGAREDVPLTAAEQKAAEARKQEVDARMVAVSDAIGRVIENQLNQETAAQAPVKQPARKRAPRKASAAN